MASLSNNSKGQFDPFTTTTPPVNTAGVTLPATGSALQGVAAPLVWAGAALLAISLAGTMFAPVIIALLAAAIWWQFLHAKKG